MPSKAGIEHAILDPGFCRGDAGARTAAAGGVTEDVMPANAGIQFVAHPGLRLPPE